MLYAICSLSAKATTSQAELHQQAQQKALQEQLVPVVPDIRLVPDNTAAKTAAEFPDESPCFHIAHVDIQGRDSFPHWVPFSSFTQKVLNRCLGINGITQLAGMIQERLASYGWATSRVLIPNQDLSQGELRLQIVPGRAGRVRLTPGSDDFIQLWNSMPVRHGRLLDLRDIEQGMENLQRPQTVEAEKQVIALTGQRYLYGYSNDEAQLRALMNNGITFAREYHLTPGIALSPEQMALLTSDMVWLVNETVTLPDGTQQTVQVPQLYVRARPGDLAGDGLLPAVHSPCWQDMISAVQPRSGVTEPAHGRTVWREFMCNVPAAA